MEKWLIGFFYKYLGFSILFSYLMEVWEIFNFDWLFFRIKYSLGGCLFFRGKFSGLEYSILFFDCLVFYL